MPSWTPHWRTPSTISNTDLERQRKDPIWPVLRYKLLSTYHRLFTFVFVANLAAVVVVVVNAVQSNGALLYNNTLTAAALNLVVGILVRQEHVINVLFYFSSALPPSAPLWIRSRVARIYHYGGVHSGCGIGASFWYLLFAAFYSYDLAFSSHYSAKIIAVAAMTYLIVLLLMLILGFAHPSSRRRHHDTFEATHRFAGWTVVALFWTQVLLQANLNSEDTGLGRALFEAPPFWCLIIITLCFIYPWVRLRKRFVTSEVLSPHAIRLHFKHATPDYCMGFRLTTSPLTETHTFATISNLKKSTGAGADKEMGKAWRKDKGFSVVISNAGDWTSHIINNPPTSIYTKGTLVYGVLRVAVIFRRTLVIATGSGISPCLSLFQGRPATDVRILWSTGKPLETYGPTLVEQVQRADPSARILDTSGAERPDLVKLSSEIVREEGCEAVAIISNAKATKKVVFGLESQGIPAYGPVFDS